MQKLLNILRLPTIISLIFLAFSTTARAQTLYEDAVCVDTSSGEFCMELFPQAAPATVFNFLKYINDGDYDDTFIHRSDPDFVIQAGGYYSSPTGAPVPKDAAIINEYNRSNLRGTVAMARRGGVVNSATSEWFVNVADNSLLDNADGGFTVFAEIISGMDIVDAINALPRANLQSSLGGAFGEVPVTDQDPGGIETEDLVLVHRVYVTDVIVEGDGDGGGDGDDDDNDVETTAEYSIVSNAFFLPVQINEALYRVIMRRDTEASGLVFSVDTTHIIAMADVGQETATMNLDAGTLSIPSIKVGDDVYTNLEFELTEFSTLTFKLVSYDKG